MTYVAPATKILTELHKADPEAPKGNAKNSLTGQPEAYDGVTVCGLQMWTGGLWREVERRDGDRVCPGCVGVAVPEQGLW